MNSDSGCLVLDSGDAQLIVDAARGGAIREFNWRKLPILRRTSRSAGADPLELACFPMVPYANRIAHGRFSSQGRAVQLKPNRPPEPHPLHGQGWLSTWKIVLGSASSATLSFEGGGDDWPWRYKAEQHFELHPNALVVRLSVQNLAPSPMPVMLGLHPYFGGAADAALQTGVPRVWLTDGGSLPVEEVVTPVDWSFDQPRAIATVPLDHCFVDWNARARLFWPDRRVEMRATHCRYLHLYAPAGRDFFCIEPQSAAAGALNRDANEATLLPPGERCEIQMSLAVEAA